MSADKRKQILIGFAGLAVILVAVIAVVRPTFRSDEATGAIGAVQKHHAPQITKADVVLGGEDVKAQQKVLFADYLADANDLRSFSFGVTQARLLAKENEVNARFANDFDVAIAMAKQLAGDEAYAPGIRSQAQGIIAILIGTKTQGDFDRTEVASRFSDLSNKLGALSPSENFATLEAAQLGLKTMARADLAMALRAHADYLGMMAKESQALMSARASLLGDGASKDPALADFAAALQERAQTNARAQLQSDAGEIAALGRMAELAVRAENRASAESLSRTVDQRIVGLRANLDAMSSFAGNRMYSSMLGDSDAFATQVKSLQDEVMAVGSHTK